MKNILIISDDIREINKLRRIFGERFKVRATNFAESALNILQNGAVLTDLAVYRAAYREGVDLASFFDLYKELRRDADAENVPLLVLADAPLLKTLTDTVELIDAALADAAGSGEGLQGVVETLFGE
jgi:PleD family two-component response regulator